MNSIHYCVGDATAPSGSGPRIVCHCCNDEGKWGRGFVLALSKRWPKSRDEYIAWFDSGEKFERGQVRFVRVETEIWVANLIGQQGRYPVNDVPPIRYDALETGLARVAEFACELKASVHMPRIGCGLAGGEWSQVEAILNRTLIDAGIAVHVYDLATT